MGRRTVHLSLDLEVDGGSLSGYVGDGAGERRAIWGRLGLLGAIERLVAEDPDAPAAVPAGSFGEPLHRPAGTGRSLTVLGARCRVLVSGAESAGSYLVMEVSVPPGAGPLPHVHAYEDLTVLLLEGEARFRLGERTGPMRVGDVVNVPRGTVHCVWNEGGAPARIVVSAMPAGMEGLITTSAEEGITSGEAAARHGITRPSGDPPPG